MPWPLHEPDPVVQRRQRLAVFLTLSVLIHAWVLLVKLPEGDRGGGAVGQVVHREPLTVRLASSTPRVPEASPPPAPREVPKPVPRPRAVTPPPSAPVIALPTPSPQSAPVATAPPQPAAPPKDFARPMDMMSMVNMARARRQAADAAAARENAQAAASEREPTPEEAADANLKRNLGALDNGLLKMETGFSLLRRGTRTAEVSYTTIIPSTGRKWHQVVEVDAGNLGDVDHAIVLSIIKVMRDVHAEKTTWESRRSGRKVDVSLDPADQPELEKFLLRDLFDDRR